MKNFEFVFFHPDMLEKTLKILVPLSIHDIVLLPYDKYKIPHKLM